MLPFLKTGYNGIYWLHLCPSGAKNNLAIMGLMGGGIAVVLAGRGMRAAAFFEMCG